MSSTIKFPKPWVDLQYFLDHFDYRDNKELIDDIITHYAFYHSDGSILLLPTDARLRKDSPRFRYIVLRLSLKKLVYEQNFKNIRFNLPRLLRQWPRFLGWDYRTWEHKFGHTVIPFGTKVDIPQEIFELGPLLEELVLDNLSLTALPDTLKNCVNLKVLKVSNNALSSLPDLSSLEHLHTLDIRYNHFSELPSWMGSVPKLNMGCATQLSHTLYKKWRAQGRTELVYHPDDCIAQYEAQREVLMSDISITGAPNESFSPTHFDALFQEVQKKYPLRKSVNNQKHRTIYIKNDFMLPLWVYQQAGMLHKIDGIYSDEEQDILAPELINHAPNIIELPSSWEISNDIKDRIFENSKRTDSRLAVKARYLFSPSSLFSNKHSLNREITIDGHIYTRMRKGKKIVSEKVTESLHYHTALKRLLITGRTTHVESLSIDAESWLEEIHSPMFFSFFPNLKHLTLSDSSYNTVFLQNYFPSRWLQKLETLTIKLNNTFYFEVLRIPYLRRFASLKKIHFIGYNQNALSHENLKKMRLYQKKIPDGTEVYFGTQKVTDFPPHPSKFVASGKTKLPEKYDKGSLNFDENPLEELNIPPNTWYVSLRNCGLKKIPQALFKLEEWHTRVNMRENPIKDNQDSHFVLNETLTCHRSWSGNTLISYIDVDKSNSDKDLVKWLRGYQEKHYTVEYYLP